ncbi:MAG: baseplate J/gp47 family protein [Treponema sp.]|nr:baseplate J/gp47 family protein [Treponema sp.]
MEFKRDSLTTLLDRAYNNYVSRLQPMERTPRYNLLKVLASVHAGSQHQLLGDLSFLCDQLFPDTATGNFLRGHWSDRVPALYASAAVGTVIQTGVAGAAVPSGLVYQSGNGKRYYTGKAYTIGADGTVAVYVTAEESGLASNADADTELSIVSSLTTGLDRTAKVGSNGIKGGVDSESDEEYLARVLEYERNSIRYGKTGDFAAWAVDATAEVTKAFEIRNFGIFGAVLIQCINGNQIDGVHQVSGLSAIDAYIKSKSVPLLYTVQTPELVQIEPTIELLATEDTAENRATVLGRLKTYLSVKAAPGSTFTQENLQSIIVDGSTISEARLTLQGGKVTTTALQYPVLGTTIWN